MTHSSLRLIAALSLFSLPTAAFAYITPEEVFNGLSGSSSSSTTSSSSQGVTSSSSSSQSSSTQSQAPASSSSVQTAAPATTTSGGGGGGGRRPSTINNLNGGDTTHGAAPSSSSSSSYWVPIPFDPNQTDANSGNAHGGAPRLPSNGPTENLLILTLTLAGLTTLYYFKRLTKISI